MKQIPRIAIVSCTGCLFILIFGAQTRADIIDDILNVSTQARDRATQARDRATEARDRATEARNRATEVRDAMQEGIAELTTAVRNFVEESADDLNREIQDELEGRAEFVGTSGCSLACEQFREKLILLLVQLESISNSTLVISGIDNFRVDFGREIGLIQNLPGRVLFPLYRMLAVESNLFESGLLDRLTEAASDFAVIEQAFAEERRVALIEGGGVDARAILAAQLAKSQWWLERITIIENASLVVAGTGVALRVAGTAFTMAGETQFEGEAQIHGYVGGSLKNNRKKKLGLALNGIGDAMLQISNYLTNKLRYAVMISTQDLILSTMETNQMKILENQERILAALGAGGPNGPGLPNPGYCGVAMAGAVPLMGLGIVAMRAARRRRRRVEGFVP